MAERETLRRALTPFENCIRYDEKVFQCLCWCVCGKGGIYQNKKGQNAEVERRLPFVSVHKRTSRVHGVHVIGSEIFAAYVVSAGEF